MADLGDAGAATLGSALRGKALLQHLDLSANSIGQKGAEALAEALKVNTILEVLDMRGNAGPSPGPARSRGRRRVLRVVTGSWRLGCSSSIVSSSIVSSSSSAPCRARAVELLSACQYERVARTHSVRDGGAV
eukprot:963528-Rhodomonas_salina.2